MANYKATGKKAKYGEIAKNHTFKLYSWEVQKVKDFIKSLRGKTVSVVFIIFLFLSCLPVHADSIRMFGVPNDKINWDISELQYETDSYKGQEVVKVFANNFGYYVGKKYVDTSKMHKSFGFWKYYVITRGRVDCYTAYDDIHLSTFKYDKVNKIVSEYVSAEGWKGKPVLVAVFKPVDDNEFRKYDKDDNLISVFSRKKSPLKNWIEYSPDGKIITNHNTDFIPYQPVKYTR